MKKLIIAVLPILMLSCVSGYTISGDAPENADYVVLSRLVGKNPIPVDTVAVENGRFLFEGHVDTPYVAYLSGMRSASSVHSFTDLCVSNADINVRNSDSDYEVTGGTENGEFNTIRAALFGEDNTPDRMYAIMDSAIKDNPQSTPYSYVLFRNLYHELSLEQLEKLEAGFDESVRQNSYLTILRDLIAQTRNSQPGNPAPDFDSFTPQGDTLVLSSLYGKWILLDFWASWCPYCRKENPQLVQLYAEYHPKGLEILSVSLDSNRDAWLEAVQKDQLDWIHVSKLDGWECKAARMYGISGIPGNVLISPDGKIAARQLHEEELENKLKSIFK